MPRHATLLCEPRKMPTSTLKMTLLQSSFPSAVKNPFLSYQNELSTPERNAYLNYQNTAKSRVNRPMNSSAANPFPNNIMNLEAGRLARKGPTSHQHLGHRLGPCSMERV